MAELTCTGDDSCPVCALRPELPEPNVFTDRWLYSWESQVKQYPKRGAPGIELVVATFIAPGAEPGPARVDGNLQVYCEVPRDEPDMFGQQVFTLLYRNTRGRVVGILNYYPTTTRYEKAGNTNTWVDPSRQRRGVGTKLHDEANRRWGPINYAQQSYSMAGHAFTTKYLERRRAQA